MKTRIYQLWHIEDRLSKGETPALFYYGPTTSNEAIRQDLWDTTMASNDGAIPAPPSWDDLAEKMGELGYAYELHEGDVS